MNEELIAYAMDFASFLMQNIKAEKSNIRNIILFGSAARGTATEKSDIDIFVNLFRPSKAVEKRISGLTKEFYASSKFREYWKLLGIENEIDCKPGKLEDWKDLKKSVVANGLVLYGKYEDTAGGKNAVLFYWDKVKPEWKRVELSKKIYGFMYNRKKHPGILEETEGTKLGMNCILIPAEAAERVSEQFGKLGVVPKIIYVSLLK